MFFREIVEKIDIMKNVPIFYRDSMVCASVLYGKSDSNRGKGIYLPNSDICIFYANMQQNNPVEFEFMKNLIETKFMINPFTFAVFNILHELGHWTQYKKYIEDGHNDCEFVMNIDADRIKLEQDRKSEAQHFTGNSAEEFNKKYSLLYLELNTEKFAHEFAIEHMAEYCEKWKRQPHK